MTGAISSIGNTVGSVVSTVANAALQVPKAILTPAISTVGSILSTPGAGKIAQVGIGALTGDIGSIAGAAGGLFGGEDGSFSDNSSSSNKSLSPSAPIIIQTPAQTQFAPAPVVTSQNNTMLFVALGGIALLAIVFIVRKKK